MKTKAARTKPTLAAMGSKADDSGVSHDPGVDLYPEVTEEVILPQRIFMFCMGVVLPVLLFDFCFSGIGYGVQVRPASATWTPPAPITTQVHTQTCTRGADHELVDRSHPHPTQRDGQVGRDPAGSSALQR